MEVLDSKGDPTVEVEVMLEDGTRSYASVPSGASTGASEAVELRDKDPRRFFGKGVLRAVANVNGPLADIVVGLNAFDQAGVDQAMMAADGTEYKSHLGGNAILGVSMAVCRAAALSQKKELYEYIGSLSNNHTFVMPQPMILVLEGGKHGDWATDIQEFMVVPKREAFPSFAECLRAGAEIFHSLGTVLEEKKYSVGVGFEGAYAPQELGSNTEAFELMTEAVRRSGYVLGAQIVFAIDAAASEFYHEGTYVLHSQNDKRLSTMEWQEDLHRWMSTYPLWSVEDPFEQEAWTEWADFHQTMPASLQLVGDDLLTTNPKRIEHAITMHAANSAIIKPNQIGTITETLQAIELCKHAHLATIASHRGGETNDDFIADLAVGVNAGQCKFGGPDRGERLAKYNRLLRIEQQLRRGGV